VVSSGLSFMKFRQLLQNNEEGQRHEVLLLVVLNDDHLCNHALRQIFSASSNKSTEMYWSRMGILIM